MANWFLALGLSGLRLLGFLTEPLLSNRDIHRVIGEPARIEWSGAAERPEPAALTVITWNIEQGMQYHAILGALRDLDADVLLLQEVDWFCRRTGFRHVAQELAHALDMNRSSGSASASS